MLFGWLHNVRAAVFCCVSGYGPQRAWRTMVWSTRWTPILFQLLHAWLVSCWRGCVWSVDGRVVVSAAFMFVHGCISGFIGGLYAVGTFVLQQALAQPDVVAVVFSPVSVMVGGAVVSLCSSSRVWLPVVLVCRIDDLFCVWCTVRKPTFAHPVSLSRCCLAPVVAGLWDVQSLCFKQGLPSALCWFAVVLAAAGGLVWGYAVARTGLAGCIRLL